MSGRLQPSVPLVTLLKTEPSTVIKNEPPEEALEKEISPDIKNIDIVYHSLSEDLIKSEIVPENILETKYLESVETQILVKTEDTSDENVTRDTNQEVIALQVSNEHSYAFRNLEIDEQSVLNFSKDLNSVSARSRKSKSLKKRDFAECYKTDDTTLREKGKEKIKVIKAPVIPVEAHEYTSLANNRHVCNHCQQTFKKLTYFKNHIRTKHRNVTTMYQCPYCSYNSKWSVRNHIIQNHKDTKDIEWFQCNLCEMKFKLKKSLTQHMKIHLTQERMQDGLDLNSYRCEKCTYKTYRLAYLKKHKLVHLKPEEIQYLYCYHCSYKFKHKSVLKNHIFRQHFKNVKQGKRYGCNKCDYESTDFNSHKLTHLKPEEIQYFYCYHCSYKTKWKRALREHIFRHFEKEQVKFDCYICNFVTSKREPIIKHIKKHSKVQNKSEINEGS